MLAPAASAQVYFEDSFTHHMNNWQHRSWDRANQREIAHGPWSLENGRLSNCTPGLCETDNPTPHRIWTSVATNAESYTLDADVYLIENVAECKLIFTNAHNDEAYRVDLMNADDRVRISAPAGSNSVVSFGRPIHGNTGYHLRVSVTRSRITVSLGAAGSSTLTELGSVTTRIFPDGKVGLGAYRGDCDFDNVTVSGTQGVGNGTANLIPVFGYERTEACNEGPYNTAQGERMYEDSCDRPLFAPWNRNVQEWWDAMVEEMQRASLTTIAAHNRGCYGADLSGPGDMCPRHLSKLITALRNRRANMKLAMWDDFLTAGAHYYWTNQQEPLSLKPENVGAWETYLWNQRWKVWYENVPAEYRYTYNGRPVVFIWFPDPAHETNQYFADTQGNISQLIKWLRAKMRGVYLVDPFIAINADMYRADDTLRTSQNADERPDLVFDWFNARDTMEGLSPIYTYNGLKGATVVPGFRDKTRHEEAGQTISRGLPGCGLGCRENPRWHGHKLIRELEHKKDAHFVLLEGWTNVIESAGFYRSLEGNDPRGCTLAGDTNTVDFPNQTLSILHRYMDPHRTILELEAETADQYRDDEPGNRGGAYRVSDPAGAQCTLNDLDIGYDGRTYYVGWVSGNELLYFRDVYLPEGTYTVTARYATPMSDATLCAQIGSGQELCSPPLTPTGAWDGTFATRELGQVTVNTGMVDVRIRFPQGWSNLDKLIFTPQLAFFDHVNANHETGWRSKHASLRDDGKTLLVRFHENGAWGPWQTQSIQAMTGLARIRSISQSPRPDGTMKQDILSWDGTTLYTRLFLNDAWQPMSSVNVSALRIPGVTSLRAWEQTGGDAELVGNRLKQSALSEDGATLYHRFFDNGVWGGWSSLPVSQLGIPNVTSIRSFSQGVAPGNITKQDVLSMDGKVLYQRTYQNGVWGPWQPNAVSWMLGAR
jgi:hypothetical protein